MDLAWNLCPHCGTPAPGLRRESMTLDEAMQPLALNLLPEEPVGEPEALGELEFPELEFDEPLE